MKKKKQIKHKLISVLVAIALIVIILIVAFGKQIKQSIASGEEINARWFLALIYPEKYSYSTEYADMNEYFQLFAPDDVAIILGDNKLTDKGKVINGSVYFPLDTAENIFTDRFYYNEDEKVLMYTTSESIYEVDVESDTAGYEYAGNYTSTSYFPAKLVGEEIYVALDYVKMFSNFEYSFFESPYRVQVYNSWDTYKAADMLKNTEVRYQGGIKSDILTTVNEGDRVQILEVMETWTKIKTADGFFGYVENNTLSEPYDATDTPVSGAYDPVEDYGTVPTIMSDVKVILGWHQIYFADDGTNLESVLTPGSCVNVVSPTWFYINSESGTFDSYASSDYVTYAHNNGYKVWALVEDMTNDFDEYALFSSSVNRKALIDNLISSVKAVGADGINVDCEKVGSQTGPHFVQFLRELAIETRKNGLVLSVDNYVQNEGNLYYDLHEQGIICDYVIIMGYDEHWAGSEPGSVASIGFVEGGISSALSAGVPADKLINAVPFYTRIWKTEGSENTSEAVGLDTCQEWLNNRGITPTWNEECCQYYAEYQDGTASYKVWVEDISSLNAKLTMMQGYNIAGCAAWKLGLGNDEAWTSVGIYMN